MFCELVGHGITVRGPQPAEVDLWADQDALRAFTVDNLRTYWRPWWQRKRQRSAHRRPPELPQPAGPPPRHPRLPGHHHRRRACTAGHLLTAPGSGLPAVLLYISAGVSGLAGLILLGAGGTTTSLVDFDGGAAG
jgi:hypothetical protein